MLYNLKYGIRSGNYTIEDDILLDQDIGASGVFAISFPAKREAT